MKKKLKAFSLLELTLSLTIIGFISTILTTSYVIISKKHEKRINEKKFHYIRISMQNYLIQKGKLPYASQNKDGNSTSNCYIGFLPYKTLGIDKSYLYDSNNQPFIYVVNSLLTSTNLPIQTPLSYHPKENEKSFLRLYKTKNNVLFYDYDSLENKLQIFNENKINVIATDDYFFVLKPISQNFKKQEDLDKWIDINTKNEEEQYKVRNIVAWLIISNNYNISINENNEMNFYITKKNMFFFQTRFDMAAQIGFYCTSEPIYKD